MKKLLLTLLCGLCLPCFAHAAAPAKNVLFIVSDDLRAGVLGCYGDKVCATPNIDRLAARGVVFERAYCQGTVCGPSRASFMCGRYFGNSGITLGEHFIAQGRTTARVGKIFHMRVPGDIIAGTDGEDVAACWTQRFNVPGREAHTPGDYACLNLNIFTTALEGRQSTGDPHRHRLHQRPRLSPRRPHVLAKGGSARTGDACAPRHRRARCRACPQPLHRATGGSVPHALRTHRRAHSRQRRRQKPRPRAARSDGGGA